MCYFTVVRVLSCSFSHLMVATALWYEQDRYQDTFFKVIWSREVKWLLCSYLTDWGVSMGRVSSEGRPISPSCFARHMAKSKVRRQGRGSARRLGDAGMQAPVLLGERLPPSSPFSPSPSPRSVVLFPHQKLLAHSLQTAALPPAPQHRMCCFQTGAAWSPWCKTQVHMRGPLQLQVASAFGGLACDIQEDKGTCPRSPLWLNNHWILRSVGRVDCSQTLWFLEPRPAWVQIPASVPSICEIWGKFPGLWVP